MTGRSKLLSAVAGAAALLAVAVVGGTQGAESATVILTNVAAPTFVGREYSDHNRMGSPICGAFVPLVNGGENQGDLDNAEGSFFAPLVLRQGSRIQAFRLFVNDADMDADVHAYLLRKRLEDGRNPASSGQIIVAEVHSSGAVTATMRLFADTTIEGPLVDNNRWMYFVEMVDCGVPEPYAVQVQTSTP